MQIEALRTVLIVAARGSFAEAARALDQDPSTVSRTVAAVEAELGIRLFQRSTRRLAPTEAGARYLQQISPLVDELDAARDEAVAGRRGPKGVLRLTTSVAFGHECVAPLLGDFAETFPDLTVELILSDANLDLIAEQIDLALRLAPAPEGGVISARLRRTRYRVCAAPAYLARDGRPERPEDLASRAVLRQSLPAYRSFWRFAPPGREAAAIEVAVDGRLVISSPLALRGAAQDGLGPALLADWLVARDLAAGRLVDLFPDWRVAATDFDTAVYCLYPSRRYLPQKVRAAIDFLRGALGDGAAAGAAARRLR